MVGKVAVDNTQITTANQRGTLQSKQSNGVIFGTVTDAADSVVADAKVYLTDIKSGAVRATQTDDYGNYRFEVAANKNLKLEIESVGFDRFTKQLSVRANAEKRVNAVLQVAVMGEFILQRTQIEPVKEKAHRKVILKPTDKKSKP